jgi:hypothetical protein
LRALRTNRDFCADEKRIRAEITVMGKSKGGFWLAFMQDRRLCADVLFIRAQSVIRADGLSSAQNRKPAIWSGAILVATSMRRL